MKKVLLLTLFATVFGTLVGSIFSIPTANNLERHLRLPSSNSLMGKSQRLFDISITAHSGIPSTDEKDLELNASIVLLQPLKGEVFYQWILPDGAQVVEGEISDSVMDLTAGQALNKKITLQGVSHEGINKLVTLQVWMEVDKVKVGGSGVFATKPSEIQFSGSQTSASGETSNSTAHSKLQAVEHRLPNTLQQ